jgi:hypothetical protein
MGYFTGRAALIVDAGISHPIRKEAPNPLPDPLSLYDAFICALAKSVLGMASSLHVTAGSKRCGASAKIIDIEPQCGCDRFVRDRVVRRLIVRWCDRML